MAPLARRDSSAASRAKRRSHASQKVVAELEVLREQVDTMTEQYRLRVSGQLAELLRAVHGDAALGQSPRLVTLKAADQILDRVRAVELKPRKGRTKDFARMEELVAALTEIVSPERRR